MSNRIRPDQREEELERLEREIYHGRLNLKHVAEFESTDNIVQLSLQLSMLDERRIEIVGGFHSSPHKCALHLVR